jgi:hypothetical protein
MNVPNRTQLKLRRAKGQAANDAGILAGPNSLISSHFRAWL